MSTPYGPGPARLVVLAPQRLRGRALELAGGEAVIGRGTDSRLVLDDPHVSRTHAVIRSAGAGAVVEDLGSIAGTRVNGVPTVGARPLRDGDVLSFAGVTARWEASGPHLEETRIRGPEPPPAGGDVRFDLGPQHADTINNVGRDQYTAYVQRRESFLREVAATRSKARALAWGGFVLLVVGFVGYAGTIFGFIEQVSSFDESTQPGDIDLLGPKVGGVPVGIIAYGLGFLGSVLFVVGIVLHIVAAARRRRVDREMPLPQPDSWPR